MNNPNAADERKRLAELGDEIPEELWPPELLPGVEEWFEAYRELGTDRQLAFSIGPIPAASIWRYTLGWDDVEAERFRFCIRVADAALLNFTHDEDKPPPLPKKTMGPEMFDAMFGGKK